MTERLHSLKLLDEAEHRLPKQHHTPTCGPGCRAPQLKHCPLAPFAPPLMFDSFQFHAHFCYFFTSASVSKGSWQKHGP